VSDPFVVIMNNKISLNQSVVSLNPAHGEVYSIQHYVILNTITVTQSKHLVRKDMDVNYNTTKEKCVTCIFLL
jgi:hypothetical protein